MSRINVPVAWVITAADFVPLTTFPNSSRLLAPTFAPSENQTRLFARSSATAFGMVVAETEV